MNAEQRAVRRSRFRLFGFEVLKGLFTPYLSGVFDDVDAAFTARQGLRGTAERKAVPDFFGRSPALADAAVQVGLEDVAAELLDASVIYLYGDASEYRGDTYWHADTDAQNARLVKFVFYDQALDAHSGALRVLLGSHRNPSAYPTGTVADAELPGHVLDVEPGDVIAFDPRVRHAALGGRVRRQVAVTYAGRPDSPAAQQELMRLVMADQTVV